MIKFALCSASLKPDQVQADCLICDVRPSMVSSGDFFRAFDAQGQRLPPARMHTLTKKALLPIAAS